MLRRAHAAHPRHGSLLQRQHQRQRQPAGPPRRPPPSTRISPPDLRRSYHAPGSPAEPAFSPPETAILAAALARVPDHGFTQQSMLLGAQDAGYVPASLALFPRGPFNLLVYHLTTQRLALKHAVQFPATANYDDTTGAATKPLGVGAKVSLLTLARLHANAPIMHKYHEALALMSLASNVPASVAELGALADDIWYLAGDTAVDGSWYTKRATLASTYAATELFMTQDRSERYAETGKFLDRRLDDVRRLGVTASTLGQLMSFTGASSVNILRSWGARI